MEMWNVSGKEHQKELSLKKKKKGLSSFWLGDLGKSPRKQGFALDWGLPASRDYSLTGYLNKSYLKERNTRSKNKAIFG